MRHERKIDRGVLMVSDPHIRQQLQLAGLRFLYSRAQWLAHETKAMGLAVKNGTMTTAELDAKLEEMGALDLVYPELMRCE
jgi:thermostable 8-oxoguanine DNA glycosylase